MDFLRDPSCSLYLPLYKKDGSPFMSEDHYGHLATVTGAIWTPQGRKFAGDADDQISLPDNDAFNLAGDFSIFIRFNADSWAGNWYEWSMSGQNNAAQDTPKWFFTYDGTQTRFEFHTGVVLRTVLGTAWTATTGQWYSISMTKIGSAYSFYQNGLPNGTATDATAFVNSSNTFLIGHGQGALDSFNGTISEIIFYTRGLYAAEHQMINILTKEMYKEWEQQQL